LKKIVIIEDDVDTLDMIEIILEENGFAVVRATRMEPIAEVISIDPNLMILDIVPPYGFGSDLCLEIKNNPKSSLIPVILYSASHNLKKFSKDCLADAYLEKPFDLDQLLEIVRETIL